MIIKSKAINIFFIYLAIFIFFSINYPAISMELTQTNIIKACMAYSKAKKECAAATNITKCVEVKIGETDAYMASSTYCDSEGNPNLWLTKKK